MVTAIQLLYDYLESKGFLIQWDDHGGSPEVQIIALSVGDQLYRANNTITNQTILFDTYNDTEVIALTKLSRGWIEICNLKEPSSFAKIDQFLQDFKFKTLDYNYYDWHNWIY